MWQGHARSLVVVQSHSGKCGRFLAKVDEAGQGNNKEVHSSKHAHCYVLNLAEVISHFLCKNAKHSLVTASFIRGFAAFCGLCD